MVCMEMLNMFELVKWVSMIKSGTFLKMYITVAIHSHGMLVERV